MKILFTREVYGVALVAPKPPQGVLVRGHAGLVINKLFPGRSTAWNLADGAWHHIAVTRTRHLRLLSFFFFFFITLEPRVE